MLTILSWGGIGDTLRNISQVPHRFLFERFGIRSRVYHLHWTKVGCHEYAAPPEPAFFEELVSRCPSLAWGGEVDRFTGTGRLVNRALRDAIKLCNGNRARYFPFSPELTPKERSELPEKPRDFCIGIQTHLSGMKTKQWGTANWQRYLELLLKADSQLRIFLLDTDPGVEELCADPRVSSTREFNLFQSMELFGYFNLVVSVDSWSKYVAAWNRIPQIVIVPDQRPEYPHLDAHKLAREEFSGIFGLPENMVIGLSGTPAAPALDLAKIAELSPELLAQRTLEQVGKIRRSMPGRAAVSV